MVFPDILHTPTTATATVTPPTQADIRVVTAGEALIDMVLEADGRLRPCLGGAVYNVTCALGLQDIATAYANPLSADRFGQALRAQLTQSGVIALHSQSVSEPTALAIAAIDAAGKASYSFYRAGVADRAMTPTDFLHATASAQLPQLQMVVTGCLALLPEDQALYQPWLAAARAAGRVVVIDANVRPAVCADAAAYRASVMRALAFAHIIKVSDDDLTLLGFASDDPVQAALQLLQATSAHYMALTLGAAGAVLLQRNPRAPNTVQAWRARETSAVTVADTVGAGDCFLAGLLAVFLQQPQAGLQGLTVAEVQHCLHRALATASLCVQQVGCVPPTAQAVQTRMQQVSVDIQALDLM